VVEIGSDSVTPTQVLSPFTDPSDLIASPYNNAVVLLTFEGNGIYRFSYDPDADPPFVNEGTIAYTGANPQLPATGVLITEGPLADHVLMTENTALRLLRFEPDGNVTDLGPIDLGDEIPGAIGVRVK